MREYLKFYIDGAWVDAASGRTFDTPNPATGEILATVAEGDAEDAVGKFEHFVEGGAGEAFDFGDAVADFADDAHIRLAGCRLEAADLGFEFLQDAAHGKVRVVKRVNGVPAWAGC